MYAIVDPINCQTHFNSSDCPECPTRTQVIRNGLKDANLHPETNLNIKEIYCKEATEEDILLVHTPKYLGHLRHVCMTGGFVSGCSDTPVLSNRSLGAILLSAGAGIAAVDKVVKGEAQRVFCNIRPPGHHAYPNAAMGYCYLNNVAIAAQKALSYESIKKVAIVDWDVHHGNGTEAIFKNNQNVLYISWHQSYDTSNQKYYPGTGSQSMENITNCGMWPGNGDKEYWNDYRVDICKKLDEFKPDIIFISCGFDGYKDEYISDTELSTDFYRDMAAELVTKAKGGRVISMLEGGYNLNTLPLCAIEHIKGLFK